LFDVLEFPHPSLFLGEESDLVGMPFENFRANGMEILRCAQND